MKHGGTSPATRDCGENGRSAWVMCSGHCICHGPMISAATTIVTTAPPQACGHLTPIPPRALLIRVLHRASSENLQWFPTATEFSMPFHPLHLPTHLRSTESTMSSFTLGPSSSTSSSSDCYLLFQNHLFRWGHSETTLHSGLCGCGYPQTGSL